MQSTVALSPELVLVSPDLWEVALARLPPPPHQLAPRASSATATAEVATAVPLVLAAVAYVVVEVSLRVAAGVGAAVAIVGAYSLLLG